MLLAGIEIVLIYPCLQLALIAIADTPAHPASIQAESLFAAMVIVLAMSWIGLYEHGQRALGVGLGGFADVFRLTFGVLLGLGTLAMLNLYAPLPVLEPYVLAIGGALALIAVATERRVFRRARSLDIFTRRILVLGVGPLALAVEAAHGDEAPYKVMAFVATGGETSCDVPSHRVVHLKDSDSLLDLVHELRAKEIVVVIQDRRDRLPVKPLLECKLQGVAITDISTFFEREQTHYFLAHHSTRPGITGWAQMRYPCGPSVRDARQKLQYALYYVKKHTLFLDLLILLETVKIVLFGRGAR